MSNITIDFDASIGKIKRMHAVNNVQSAPTDSFGGLDLLAAANVPYSRLHDTGGAFGGSRFVDVPNIFPNFGADENDPASYDFCFTDVLLSGMNNKGIKPLYRLGATIECFHKIKAYNIYPPKDFEKWARICEHIIMHYNEGWANGFHMGIEYWEIWNEPDNEPVIEENPCWRGTKEEFFELYRIVSTHLKAKFPELKIGGYASCGFYALTDALVPAANSSPRLDYFLEFFEDFLDYAHKHNCIMDFFSWHSYASVENNVAYAQYARERLNAHGFLDCEIFLNEWNPGCGNRGTTRDAADILAMMIAMQNTSTDMCMYYDAAESSIYCGIFNPISHGVFKAYYSFYIFGQMFAMGEQCFSHADNPVLFVMAAKGNNKKAIAIVNDSDCEKKVKILVNGAELARGNVKATDDEHTFDDVQFLREIDVLPPFSIRYIEFE